VLAQEGKTIFISSHNLSELGEMCDSLLFVNNGRIVHHGDSDSLKHGTDAGGGVLYDVQVVGDPQAVSDWCVINPHVEFLESRKQGGRIRIDTTAPEKAAETLARMVKDGLKVVEFHKEQRNLEDAFIDMLGRIDRGESAQPEAHLPPEPSFSPPSVSN
jgi:ABC-2 type transport system ATP-binding protein